MKGLGNLIKKTANVEIEISEKQGFAILPTPFLILRRESMKTWKNAFLITDLKILVHGRLRNFRIYGGLEMICKNCGKPIIQSNATTGTEKWRHRDDQMFTCFDSNGPMRVGDEYLRAEPKEK